MRGIRAEASGHLLGGGLKALQHVAWAEGGVAAVGADRRRRRRARVRHGRHRVRVTHQRPVEAAAWVAGALLRAALFVVVGGGGAFRAAPPPDPRDHRGHEAGGGAGGARGRGLGALGEVVVAEGVAFEEAAVVALARHRKAPRRQGRARAGRGCRA